MIEKVVRDVANTDENLIDTKKEISLIRLRLNEIESDVEQFKSDVQRDYVSKENWDASQALFESWKNTQEEAYQESLSRFEQLEATMESLDLETTALFVSQDQKILFLQQELNALRDMLGESNEVIVDIQNDLSVLNKIQEDYPSIDLKNQLTELRVRMDDASIDIIDQHTRLDYHLGNITAIRELISSLGNEVVQQRQQLLILENQMMSGGNANISAMISSLQQQIHDKVSQDQLVTVQQEINFQRTQLEQLEIKLNLISVGNGTSGVNLQTMQRIQMLETQVNALLYGNFTCGNGNIELDCAAFIQEIFSSLNNMTLNITSNQARIDEINEALTNLGSEVDEIRAIMETGGISPQVIASIQNKLIELEIYDLEFAEEYAHENAHHKFELDQLKKLVDSMLEVQTYQTSDLEKLKTTTLYLEHMASKLPDMQVAIDFLFEVYHRMENQTFYLINRNKEAIDALNTSMAQVLPTLSILGQEAEILKIELTGEIAQIRSEFLDLPDSPRLQEYIGDINDKLHNISMEVLLVSQKQSHYDFQKNRLDIMRSDLNHLANMTALLYNKAINSTHNLIINASDIDPNINKTLGPLIRRIEIMESVVNAHKEMNFSKQIMNLHSMIDHHTKHMHKMLEDTDHSVELTESQLSELAERIAVLEPSQEVLHIRDELNRLSLLEQNFPLINMSTEIHQLAQRISVFETLLPPDTLEAILTDIQTLKNQLDNNPNDGKIMMIETSIGNLVEATQTHAGHLEDLDAINQLMLEHSSDRDVQIAELYVELDTLENAINSVINGQIEDLGIPNVIQGLHDDDQETRDMLVALKSELEELKHTLRYYETCSHTDDCHVGQRCNKHSECLWEEASVVCAWQNLDCGSKCHYNGHCRMLKHVWASEFNSSCPASNCSDYVLNDEDLTLELIGDAEVNLTLGEDLTWNDPGAVCSDHMWKYKVSVEVYPPFRTNVVDDYIFTYQCGNSLSIERIVHVKYAVCDYSYWIDCPDGSRQFERPDRSCTIKCDATPTCDKPGYAGPGCKCSPILDGCVTMYGDVEATWDGTNCGCKCNGKLLLNNHCV